MKTKWKALTLLLAAMLLFTACEERRTVDISDGGNLAQPAVNVDYLASAGEETVGMDSPETAVTLVSMSLKSGGSGTRLVPLEPGGVFVINNVLADNCTITSNPKDLLIADCTLKSEEAAEVELEFKLFQDEKEIMTAGMTAALEEGENTIQVLIRLEGSVSGKYQGRLYVNGALIGSESGG